jgi:dienelactone hydrolase
MILRPLLALLLAASPAAATTVCDAVWRDAARGRDLPVRITLPAGSNRVPGILFSPGLGGTRSGGGVYAAAWAAQGLAVVQLEHPGSDAAIYAGAATPQERRARINAAASPQQLLARTGDVGFVADELARRERGRRREGSCDLGRIDTDRLGLAGHSMGAWTVQAMAGQRFAAGSAPLQDMRFRAFIAFSPTAWPGLPADVAFGSIHRPFMVITGTRDGVPANGDPKLQQAALAQRTGVFAGLPADGRKAQALFDGATHMMFAGNQRPPADRLGQHVQAAIVAISSAWWQRWLLADEAAEAVLSRPSLGPADRWERK